MPISRVGAEHWQQRNHPLLSSPPLPSNPTFFLAFALVKPPFALLYPPPHPLKKVENPGAGNRGSGAPPQSTSLPPSLPPLLLAACFSFSGGRGALLGQWRPTLVCLRPARSLFPPRLRRLPPSLLLSWLVGGLERKKRIETGTALPEIHRSLQGKKIRLFLLRRRWEHMICIGF